MLIATALLVVSLVGLGEASCPTAFPSQFEGKCYKISSGKAYSEVAQAACHSIHGELAKIADRSAAWIINFANFLGTGDTWIGLRNFRAHIGDTDTDIADDSQSADFRWLIDNSQATDYRNFVYKSDWQEATVNCWGFVNTAGKVHCHVERKKRFYVCQEPFVVTTLAPTTLGPATLGPTTLAHTTLAPTALAPTALASSKERTLDTTQSSRNPLLSTATAITSLHSASLSTASPSDRLGTSTVESTGIEISQQSLWKPQGPPPPDMCTKYRMTINRFDKELMRHDIGFLDIGGNFSRIQCVGMCSNSKLCLVVIYLADDQSCWLLSQQQLSYYFILESGNEGYMYAKLNSS